MDKRNIFTAIMAISMLKSLSQLNELILFSYRNLFHKIS